MRALLNKTAPTKKVNFMGEKNSVELKKMTGKEVKQMQADIKELQTKLPEDEQGLAIQNLVIRTTVVGAEDMTDEEFDEFPLDEVANLAKSALEYSGIRGDAQGNG